MPQSEQRPTQEQIWYRMDVQGRHGDFTGECDPWRVDDTRLLHKTRFPHKTFVEQLEPKRFTSTPLTSDVRPELETEFYEIYADWRKRTGRLSLFQGKFDDPAYVELIGMGRDILPLVFREFEKAPSNWFWLLARIARREAPAIPSEYHGRVRKIAEIWLKWGADKGYVRL